MAGIDWGGLATSMGGILGGAGLSGLAFWKIFSTVSTQVGADKASRQILETAIKERDIAVARLIKMEEERNKDVMSISQFQSQISQLQGEVSELKDNLAESAQQIDIMVGLLNHFLTDKPLTDAMKRKLIFLRVEEAVENKPLPEKPSRRAPRPA